MRSWLHSPGITLAGRCRLRNGTIVTLEPFGYRGTPAVYRSNDHPLYFDADGNAFGFGNQLGFDCTSGQWDVVENLENLHRREQ